jgi:beta-glucoside operon transcriptional antiterminator
MKMLVIKILNNNAAFCVTDDGEEVIVSGPGVGYNRKIGSQLKLNKKSKIYRVKSDKEQISDALLNIPTELLEISQEIVEYAEKMFDKKISDILVVVLADHIMSALQRQQNHLVVPNLLLEEIQALYEKEFLIGEWAIGLIKERLNLVLPRDEIGYIALHILNSGENINSAEAVQTSEVVAEIIEIIEKNHHYRLEKPSTQYNRLVTHLKFLVQRLNKQEQFIEKTSSSTYEFFLKENPSLEETINEICHFLVTNYKYKLTTEEKFYLSIHVNKVIEKGSNHF